MYPARTNAQLPNRIQTYKHLVSLTELHKNIR